MELIVVGLEGARAEEFLALLPGKRAEELCGFSPASRLRSAAAETALRTALSERGIPYFSPIVREGKPHLSGQSVCFNLAHSGDRAVCAIGETPVGVDIERVRPVRFDAIARRCFSEAEREEIARSPDPLKSFFRVFTARESLVKRSGEGIRAFGRAEGEARSYLLDGETLSPFSPSGAGEYVLSVCGAEEFVFRFFSAEEALRRGAARARQ